MSIRTSPWPAGMPCWVDLGTPDVAAAEEFYAALLGWSFPPAESDYGGYVIGEVGGAATAGIGPLQGDQQRPSWTLYLASDDAAGTEEAISAAGGTVLVPNGDVGGLGRMLVASDPSGGVFGVWQAGTHIGASLVNEPGGLSWEDLRSTDPRAAQEFYARVFGYELHPLEAAGAGYDTFHLSGDPAPLGGMGGLGEGVPQGTPSHWIVYFSVADADEAVRVATSHGGSVLTPAFTTPYGRMAGLVDPAGAAFWISQAMGNNPDPGRSG